MKVNKKLTAFAIFILVFSVFCSNLSVFAVNYGADALTLDSKSAYVVYMGENGDIPIVDINSRERIYPASLTKIMTAIVLLEKEGFAGLENKTMTVPGEAFDDFYVDGIYQYPSTADFLRGEEVDLRDLLYGMMLPSACEAANCIAYYVGEGNISKFVDMMNETAKKIGANDTHFANPHGLFNENQYTTAYDMYLIARYACNIEGFMEVVDTESFYLRPTNLHSDKRLVVHTNYMMSLYRGGERYYYPYVHGIKTGTLDEAGRNLVSTATKDGYTYMAITLGGPQVDADGNTYYSNFADHKKLYEWAFDNFEVSKVVNTGSDVMEFSVRNSSGKDYVIARTNSDYLTLLPKNIEPERIKFELPTADILNAPIKKDQELGEMKVYIDGDYMTNIELVAAEDVDLSVIKYIFWLIGEMLTSKVFVVLLILVIIFIAIYVFLFYKRHNKKRKEKEKRKQMR